MASPRVEAQGPRSPRGTPTRLNLEQRSDLLIEVPGGDHGAPDRTLRGPDGAEGSPAGRSAPCRDHSCALLGSTARAAHDPTRQPGGRNPSPISSRTGRPPPACPPPPPPPTPEQRRRRGAPPPHRQGASVAGSSSVREVMPSLG